MTRPGVRCDTTGQACDTAERGTTTRSRVHHDTAPCARPRRKGRAMGAQARQGVHLLHPTSLSLSALFLSYCLGHCSQDFSKKNQIKSNEIKSFKMKFSKIKFLLLKMI